MKVQYIVVEFQGNNRMTLSTHETLIQADNELAKVKRPLNRRIVMQRLNDFGYVYFEQTYSRKGSNER